MFKQGEHREQDPQTGQKGGGGVGTFAFRLPTAEANEHVFSSVAAGDESACNCQTTTQAMAATNNRRRIAGPLSCCQDSSWWP